MTLENHLKLLAENSKRNMDLYETWKFLKREIGKILDNISIYFPHFSLHDSSHSKTICIQIERLLGAKRISQLSVTDTLVMLMAFYCHDLGMAIKYEEVERFLKSKEYQDYLIKLSNDRANSLSDVAQKLLNFDFNSRSIERYDYVKSIEVYNWITFIIEDYFRKNHAKRSGDIIKKYLIEKFQIDRTIGIRFVNTLCEICKLHQEDIDNILKLPSKTNGMTNDYMHPRLIASMLCLGDLLDLDTNRFNKHLLEAVIPIPVDSEIHFKKHESIKHFLVYPNGIEIVSDCDDRKVYRVMRDWINWINDAVKFISLEWNKISPENFGNAPSLLKKELYLNGDTKWLEYSDLNFTISQKRAIELLQGANIYKNKYVCLREIIQNAVDATIIQVWKELHTENKYEFNCSTQPNHPKLKKISEYIIKLKISIDKENNVVVEIIDNGTGISIEDLKYLSNIGNKSNYKKKKIIESMPEWIKPSGSFGLGLQSIFLLTDSFQIITKTDDEPAKSIILENISNNRGYIIVDEYKQYFKRGTKIIIKIDSGKINIDDLECSEYFYKTEPKCNLIINALDYELNNIDKNRAPFLLRRLQYRDYVSVEVECEKLYTSNYEKIMKYESIFSNYLEKACVGELENKVENIFFEYYDEKTMCICNVEIVQPKEKNYIYGKYDYSHYRFNRSIFFKNVFVKDEIIKYSLQDRHGLYRNIDFSINILANDAEKILTISRNDIKKSYEREFKRTYETCIENTLKKLLDKVIDEENRLGSVLIKIFQISTYYNYRTEDLLEKYNAELNNYTFDNYLKLKQDCSENKMYKFCDINGKYIYFLIDEIDKDICDGIDRKEILDLSEELDKCVFLKDEAIKEKHILSHQISKVFIGSVGNKYYRCIKAKPFYTNNINVEYEKDDFIFLYDFILAVYKDYRCMRANKKFSKISTTISSNRIYYNDYKCKYIELPFTTEEREILKKIIKSNNTHKFDKEQFLDSIYRGDIYRKNVEYISKCNELVLEDAEENYKHLLNTLLNLLVKEEYKEYINFIIKEFEENLNSREGIYEKIDYNCYISF
ncbi:HD domain-containing protein [Tepidibacter sp. Z1-5]|uniref:HD domain-containing protein n=1 Tax=Tepidibacter sp. Z1-5 TaxID=3134138 RepID=UPI0030C5E680